MEFTDDDLDEAPVDRVAFIKWLALKLKRAPTYGEVVTARMALARLRRRSLRARKAPRRTLPPITVESPSALILDMLTSPDFVLVFALMWAALDIGALWLWRPAIMVPVAAMRPSKAPRRETSPAVLENAADRRERRRDWLRHTYGDADYPAALAALLRTAGAPVLSYSGGRSAWDVVEACDPDVTGYLRSLGTDPRQWSDARREVGSAAMKAGTAALRAYKKGDEDKASHLLHLAYTPGAAAYAAKTSWRHRAQLASVDLLGDDEGPQLTPEDEAAPTPVVQ